MNNIYDTARRRMLSSDFDWVNMAVRLLAYNESYIFDASHNQASDLGRGDPYVPILPVAESELLVDLRMSTSGFAISDPAWFQSPALGAPWLFLLIVDETGGLAAGARKLVAYYDVAVNLPRTINGQDEVVVPDALLGWFQP